MSPNDIPQDQQDWYENERDYELKQRDLKEAEQKYKVGDHVRVASKKGVFSKGAKKFSVGIYRIVQVDNQSIKKKVENIKSGKQKVVRPQQIQLINENQLIQQKEQKKESQKQQNKKEVQQAKNENKQKKYLKREGINPEEIFKPAPIKKNGR